MTIAKSIVGRVLSQAGITINGNQPWDIQVHDESFYSRVLTQGSLGLGESYMEGLWDCPHLDQAFERVLKNGLPWFERFNPFSLMLLLKSKFKDLAPKEDAFLVGEAHYDLGRIFEAMLDPTMAYSCAYFGGLDQTTANLQLAQVAKFDLICRKLGLQEGQRVLDIGCGWGGFAWYAAAQYGAEVVGLTVSKEQAEWAKEISWKLPVEIRLQDYRDLTEKFDHIVSVGMFEHVGAKNYRRYMNVIKKCLRPKGLFLLHTIGRPDGFHHSIDPWLRKYIFPIGEIPKMDSIISSFEKEGLRSRDWHDFGPFYDTTLMAWHERFNTAWPRLEIEYGDMVHGQFYRMWRYYLLACAALFRVKHVDLWQVVISHQGKHLGYRPVR